MEWYWVLAIAVGSFFVGSRYGFGLAKEELREILYQETLRKQQEQHKRGY